MKENGINTLIELLNEYEISKSHRDYEWKIEKQTKERMCGVEYTGAYIDTEEMERIIISKRYWFIKRLVDNHKIDLDKVEKKFYNEICITDYGDKDRIYGESDLVIAVLSISDTPIEDLISYLK